MMTAREEATRLSDLLRREHHALGDFLVALARFDAERQWLDLGHRTLFDFLVRDLGLSAGAAFYRKTAAILLQEFPEVVEPLRDGRLCFTAVIELARCLTPENRATVLPRFFHVSKKEAKAIAAELHPLPAPPMRTVVTAVAGGTAGRTGAQGASSASVGAATSGSEGAAGSAGPAAGALASGVGGSADLTAGAVESGSAGPGPGAVSAARAAGAAPLDLAPASATTSRLFHPDETLRASPTVPDVAPPLAATAGTAARAAAGIAAAPPRAAAPAHSPLRALRPADIEPLTGELSRLHVTVPRRLLDKLAAARDALSQSHPGASEDTILEVGLDLILQRHAKRRGLGAKPRNRAPAPTEAVHAADPLVPAERRVGVGVGVGVGTGVGTGTGVGSGSGSGVGEDEDEFGERMDLRRDPPPATDPRLRAPAPASMPRPGRAPPRVGRSRRVPAAVWRTVWARDGGCCAWPLDDGGVCGSTYQLQLDHVDGWALGADTTVDACRLLCRTHNDAHARRLYGDAHMDRFTRSPRAPAPPRGGRCSEPVAAWSAG